MLFLLGGNGKRWELGPAYCTSKGLVGRMFSPLVYFQKAGSLEGACLT